MDRKKRELNDAVSWATAIDTEGKYDELLLEARRLHAEVVYRKCVRGGKLKWAARIGLKYGLFEGNDDTVVALRMAFLCGVGVGDKFSPPFDDY